MKKFNTIIAASALSVVAASSQAALIDISVGIDGTIAGAAPGTITGSMTGTYDDVTGQILVSGSNTNVTTYTNATIDLNQDLTGLVGTGTNTGCTSAPGALIDLCAGNAAYGVAPLPIGVPAALALVSNTVDATGNGAYVTSESQGTGATAVQIDVTYTVTASAVPVPAAAWLFGSALIGLAGIGRKRTMK